MALDNPRSTPPTKHGTPSTGVNLKVFVALLMIAGMLAAFILFSSGEGDSTPADTNNPDPTGQGSGSNSPAAAVETATPSETETPNEETDRINSFWHEMGDTEEDAKPVATEVEIQYLDYLDYDPEDIGAFNKGYYPASTKVFGPVAIHGLYGENAIEVIPVGSVILSDMKVSEAKVEFYIENTEEYAKTVSPFIISIKVETVDTTTGEIIEIPFSRIYRTEKMRLEPGEKEKVVIGEDLIRSLITKGYPLKIVDIRVDTR